MRSIISFLLLSLSVLTACNAILGIEAGELPPRDDCSVAPQAGCAANETCIVISENGILDPKGARRCQTAGSGARGAKCSEDNQCAPGLACGPTGACVAYCKYDPAAADPNCDGFCYAFPAAEEDAGANESAPVQPDVGRKFIPHASYCLPRCNPLAPQCNGGNCAYYDVPGVLDGWACSAAGSGGQGAICESAGDCQPGFSCSRIQKTAPARCAEGCQLNPPTNNCPQGTFCNGYLKPNIVDGVEFGACQSCVTTPQYGCQPGETCVAKNDGSTSCIKGGTLTEGSACSSPSDCLPGLTCAQTCTQFCPKEEVGPKVCEGSPCFQATVGSGADKKPVPGVFLCQAACNPLNTNACPGATCVVYSDNTTDCLATGNNAVGLDCASDRDCVAGALCDNNLCKKWCTGIGTQGTCVAGEKCDGFASAVVVGGVTLGACNPG